jgi:hypothetical protein
MRTCSLRPIRCWERHARVLWQIWSRFASRGLGGPRYECGGAGIQLPSNENKSSPSATYPSRHHTSELRQTGRLNTFYFPSGPSPQRPLSHNPQRDFKCPSWSPRRESATAGGLSLTRLMLGRPTDVHVLWPASSASLFQAPTFRLPAVITYLTDRTKIRLGHTKVGLTTREENCLKHAPQYPKPATGCQGTSGREWEGPTRATFPSRQRILPSLP